MKIDFTDHDLMLFDDFDQANDWTRRAPEELSEAAVAIHHHVRGKITPEAAMDEMADAIISAAHAGWKMGGLTELNKALARKIEKARTPTHDSGMYPGLN